jgi:hypothetical protein
MDRISCLDCGQCNRKGKPSVMRFSAYCDSHIKQGISVNRVGLFERFKDFITQRRYDEKENMMKTTKGFRPSWFWR